MISIKSETSTNNALCFEQVKDKLIYLIDQDIDDSFQAGKYGFFKETEKTLEKFINRDQEYGIFKFSWTFVCSKQHNFL